MTRRQSKNRKIKLPSFVKNAKDYISQTLVVIFVVITFVVLMVIAAKAFLYRSDYFRLRTVEIKSSLPDAKSKLSINSQLLALYGGRNVLQLNLKDIAQSIRTAYPDTKNVVAGVSLPDKLSVNLVSRIPVAILKDERLFAVDDEGFVMSGPTDELVKTLPIIEGIDVRYVGRQARVSMPRNLASALELLREVKASRAIRHYGIASIDAGSLSNLSFYFKNGVEVKIGSDNFKKRLAILADTAKDPRLLMDRIRYIDVRFEEVVIGPKE